MLPRRWLEAEDAPVAAHLLSSAKNSRIVVAVRILQVSEESQLASSPSAARVGTCHGAGLGKSPMPETAAELVEEARDAREAADAPPRLRRETSERPADESGRAIGVGTRPTEPLALKAAEPAPDNAATEDLQEGGAERRDDRVDPVGEGWGCRHTGVAAALNCGGRAAGRGAEMLWQERPDAEAAQDPAPSMAMRSPKQLQGIPAGDAALGGS